MHYAGTGPRTWSGLYNAMHRGNLYGAVLLTYLFAIYCCLYSMHVYCGKVDLSIKNIKKHNTELILYEGLPFDSCLDE